MTLQHILSLHPSGPDTGVTPFTNQALYEYTACYLPVTIQLSCSVQGREA